MTTSNDPSAATDGYFDEAYFERGWERGTAYVNYRKEAEISPIYHALADMLASVFRPHRSLEIGCATGPIVRDLNAAGIGAVGIDVSEWAVENALHPNVILASAAQLPHQAGSFDLVYSSHALEHLPLHVYEEAFREIDRVCSRTAVQFHMLPIIGTYPYDYDPETALTDLKKDPTHVLLKPMSWWLEQWSGLGWVPIDAAVLLPDDTSNVELSSGQFCLVRQGSGLEASVAHAVRRWNDAAFRRVSVERNNLNRPRPNVESLSTTLGALSPALGPHAIPRWDDLVGRLAAPANFNDAKIEGVVHVDSAQPVQVRIALISISGGVMEKWLVFEPGWSRIHVPIKEFVAENENGSLVDISAIFFGGTIGNFSVCVALSAQGPNTEISSLFKPQ